MRGSDERYMRQKTIGHITFTTYRGPLLPAVVKEIVEVRGHSVETETRLYPSNTPEILINLARPICGKTGSITGTIRTCTIQGSKTSLVRAWHPKYCHFISVRFAANGCFKVLGIPQEKFTGSLIDFEDVVPGHVKDVIPELRQAPDARRRFRIVCNWLRTELGDATVRRDLLSDYIIARFENNPYMSVKELVAETGFTRKHLGQRFKEEAGLSLKTFQKVERLQSILKTIRKRRVHCWAELACDNRYYDQSHFIKDFKQFTGSTPGAFIQNLPQ